MKTLGIAVHREACLAVNQRLLNYWLSGEFDYELLVADHAGIFIFTDNCVYG